MNNYWAFLPMRASNDLLGDHVALRERFDEDSYLYFQDVLDRDKLKSLRKSMLTVLAQRGWVRKAPYFMRGVATAPPVREGDEDFFTVYDDVQKLEEFHTLAHDDELMGEYQSYLAAKLPLVTRVDVENIKTLLLTSTHPAAKSGKPEEFIDNSMVEEIVREGFVKQFEQ